jgi:hypothetical protein
VRRSSSRQQRKSITKLRPALPHSEPRRRKLRGYARFGWPRKQPTRMLQIETRSQQRSVELSHAGAFPDLGFQVHQTPHRGPRGAWSEYRRQHPDRCYAVPNGNCAERTPALPAAGSSPKMIRSPLPDRPRIVRPSPAAERPKDRVTGIVSEIHTEYNRSYCIILFPPLIDDPSGFAATCLESGSRSDCAVAA